VIIINFWYFVQMSAIDCGVIERVGYRANLTFAPLAPGSRWSTEP
jgi:hypothetical protein